MSNENKKDHPNASTSERSAETKHHDNDTYIPIIKYSITANKLQPGVIEKLLPCGEENAISTKDLVSITGFKNSRTLQGAIAFERAHGALILSTGKGGYFTPDEGDKGRREITDFVRTLQSRAANTYRALHAAKKALSGVEDQTELEGWWYN